MNKKNKILSLILVVFILMTLGGNISVSAETLSKTTIITKEIPKDITNYAISELNKQKNIAEDSDIRSSSLGTPFQIFSYLNKEIVNSSIYYFPLLKDDKITGFMTIFKKGDEYFSNISKSFSEELNNLLENNDGENIILYSIENDIYAIINSQEYLLSLDYTKENHLNEEDINAAIEKLNSEVNFEEEQYVNVKEALVYMQPFAIEGGPTAYKTLNVNIVLQGNHPWCAGATIAGILNYKLGKSLTAKDVITYYYGSAVESGLPNTAFQSIYSHYGYSVTVDNALTYTRTKSLINANWPIHMSMYATSSDRHSMTLRGYYEYSDGSKYYSVIDPNYNYYININAYDSGNSVYYILNNMAFYWNKSAY